MFDKLIRRVFDSAVRARVGFLSEPTAILGGDKRDRKVRAVSLEEWAAIDKQNGDDAAAASIDRYSDGKDYAVIVTARDSGVTVVALGDDRAEFLRRFFADGGQRSIIGGSIREARINPPPPPPPPGHPPWDLVGRLDAILRVGSLPVVEGIIDPNFRDTLVDNVRGPR